MMGTFRIFGVAVALILIAGCSGTKIISRAPDKVAIEADGSEYLPEATKVAAKYCKGSGRRAELSRTERSGKKGIVTYYDCK